jgi:hypothetical protein
VASKPFVIFVGLVGVVSLRAHEPITTKLTWTQEISRIIFRRCASCHNAGGTAFPLINYADARPWAKAIREEVLERRMPPWGAVEGVRAFREDPSLTPLEIEMIVGWVEGGAPEGDPAYLPPLPKVEPQRSEGPARSAGLEIVNAEPKTLRGSIIALGITPRDVPNGASMEVTACKPDGSVEHLIWLRNYREEWTRTYWFRDPLPLPEGTHITVFSTGSATAVISLRQ